MERSNREIALTLAVQYTQGVVDERGIYTPPTLQSQMEAADFFLAFLEADEVAE